MTFKCAKDIIENTVCYFSVYVSSSMSGYSKNYSAAGRAAKEDGDYQCSSGNQQDAENGPR